MSTSNITNKRYAGFFRRLFAIFYDCFLLIAILFIISYVAMAINSGKAIEPDNTFYPVYIIIIVSVCYLYFAWFWMHGGQTLGMKTWKIQLLPADNLAITWRTTVIRFITAIISWGACMLGFLWIFFDKKNRSWHDLSSNTVVIDLRD